MARNLTRSVLSQVARSHLLSRIPQHSLANAYIRPSNGTEAANHTTKANVANNERVDCMEDDTSPKDASEAVHRVRVTQIRSSVETRTKPTQLINSNNESSELVDTLLARTSEMMDPHAANVVAYSGGVDSSLVAALVHRAFSPILQQSTRTAADSYGQNGSVQAVLGISPAVPRSQIEMARRVAETIGIPLTEVPTIEGSDDTYQRNDGYACYVCKTHLYSTLETVADAILKQQRQPPCAEKDHTENHPVILYNGTNADDTRDPTRLGLIAADNFQVHSPLDQITKDQVRQAAKHLGLPNWNSAASPCLRSRLAMGVMATEEHLKAVEMAEEFVRRVLSLDDTVNARVRMMAGGKAIVELDQFVLESNNGGQENWAAILLQDHGFEQRCIDEWGFNSFGGVRGFKTGSVAAMPTEDIQPPLVSVAT
ncbi:hypothetical protein ACHAWF_015288 [Thalassiosira exigua]